MKTQEMALITRDALLLPDGRLELNIITPHHLRMIADVCKGKYPLAFGMLKANGTPPCYPSVTQCEIIDFNQLNDTSLSIVLEGKQRVKILSAARQRNGIWMARTIPSSNWHEEPIRGEFELISAALEQFFEVNPNLFELYSKIHLEDASWVSQRWLEVLPLYNKDKLTLINQPDCHQTMEFVLELIKSHAD
ncbi:ATP-dependent protease [Shewanella hanedai]|jgi:Lon protease-like protein|uniref:ATP-dependent protease n=1 Tax=Shewanella hanedai TaxID=25 RepID=A0A553JUJ1_SHEHA|nr:LON peptidase substrate-binding domain-containing protein [Shewanella hanedai]TRY16118.1 ATP-dependent protease [Shewanella hanedai]GGI91095.1 ATP-dependent protease [Shewanella hanedai]